MDYIVDEILTIKTYFVLVQKILIFFVEEYFLRCVAFVYATFI